MQDKKIMFVWTKTLLSIFKYVDTLTEAIDDLVYKQGINSGFGAKGVNNSAYNCASKMIELTERKRKLLIVKNSMEDAFASLPKTYMRLLALTYVDCLKSVDVADAMKISLRTFFRKKNDGIYKLAHELNRLGLSGDKLNDLLCEETWLIDLYNGNMQQHIIATREVNDVEPARVREYRLLKNIIKDLNKTASKQYYYR